MDSYDITQDELIQMEQEHYASNAFEQQPPFSPENDAEFMAYMEELADAPQLDGTEELLFADETLDDLTESVDDWAPWVAPTSPIYSDNSSHQGVSASDFSENSIKKSLRYFNLQ